MSEREMDHIEELIEELNKRTHVRWIREKATDAQIEDLRQHRNEMRQEIGELHRENERLRAELAAEQEKTVEAFLMHMVRLRIECRANGMSADMGYVGKLFLREAGATGSSEAREDR